MEFKFVLLSVACIAFIVQPAHCDFEKIRNATSTVLGTVREIAAVVPKAAKAKGSAVAKGAADIASIFTTGLGLKVRALGTASSSFKDAISGGLVGVGQALSSVGTNMVNDILASGDIRPMSRTPVADDVVEEVKVVEFPVESYPMKRIQLRVRPSTEIVELVSNKEPSVWEVLKNAAESRSNRVEKVFHIENRPSARTPVVYEIIDTPRGFQGPLIETFQLEMN